MYDTTITTTTIIIIEVPKGIVKKQTKQDKKKRKNKKHKIRPKTQDQSPVGSCLDLGFECASTKTSGVKRKTKGAMKNAPA